MIGKKELTNVEYFNCLDNVVTNEARCVREIKPWIVIAKPAEGWRVSVGAIL
jgi:hypothetical protein